MSGSSSKKDLEVLKCRKQNDCETHDKNCSTGGILFCTQAKKGFWLDNKLAKPCSNQTGCKTNDKNRVCVNQKYYHCLNADTGYKVLNGIVSEKGCDFSQSKFNKQKGTNCGSQQWPLSSGASCTPTCNSGYTLSKKTQCKLGTLTEGTCDENSCDGKSKDNSGKVSIKPTANPHTLNTDEYKAWKSGTCQPLLKSGGKCKPTCGTGYMNVPKESICQTGSLTPSMCVKKPCLTNSPFTVTVKQDNVQLKLHKELSGNKEQYKFSCGGDKVYNTGWDKKYQGMITLTCDKGSINVNNTCQFYKKCPTSFSSQCVQTSQGGGCHFNQKKQTLECLCLGNYIGDGTKSGSGCTECKNSQKNICDTHNTQSKCNGDQNCQWTSNKCQIKSGKQEIQQGKMKGCICDPGYYLVKSNDQQCSPYGGSCTNGTLANQSQRTQNNHCGTCNSGFTLTNKQCKKNCSYSKPMNGGMGNCTNTLPYGGSCKPICDKGYTMSGSVKCLDKLTQVTCTPSPCNIKAPSNGKVGNCNPILSSGSSCQPVCDTGYTVSGKITCNKGVPTAVTCDPNPCSTTKPINGDWGTCTSKTIQSGNTCTATCGQGYTISGKSTCKAGKFTSGTCKENICKLPDNTFGIYFPTRPTKLITVKDLISKHKPTLNKSYFNPYGVCSDKQSKTQNECLTKKGVWTSNQGFKFECNTMNGVFTIKHPPQKCVNQAISVCKSSSDNCINTKLGENGYGKMKCKSNSCSELYNDIDNDGICKPNICVCSNGTIKKNCNNSQGEQCSKCNQGYHLKEGSSIKKVQDCVSLNSKCRCKVNICKCSNGVPYIGFNFINGKTMCEKHGSESCKKCKTGYNKYFGRYCYIKCKNGEYLHVEPTMTSGVIQSKVCKPHTVCKVGEYEDKAPSGTSTPIGGGSEGGTKTNRTCKPITPPCCDKKTSSTCLMYEEKPPSGVSGNGYKQDRVCKNLTLCDGGDEYVLTDKVWNSTSKVFVKDNVCKKFNKCDKNEYEDTPPSKDKTTHKLIKDRVCKKLKDCQPGEYVKQTGGYGKPRICEKCPPNTFSVQKNSSSCSNISICRPGLMTDKKHTLLNDRTCKACPVGKTSKKPHNDTCPEIEIPTQCTCKNGAPIGGCKTAVENCKVCNTGYILRKEGETNKCVSIKLNQLCSNGNVQGKIETGNSQCNCFQGYFGGGSWTGGSYPPCKEKVKCVCPNGIGATNEPCGPNKKRSCPRINSKGNIDIKSGKPIQTVCLKQDSPLCESCNEKYKMTSDKTQCIKECQVNQFYNGKDCINVSFCNIDEFELYPPNETNDRICKPITKKCPPGQTIIKKATRTSDTVCSEQYQMLRFQTQTQTSKQLQKCLPVDNKEVTFGLCHIQDVKRYQYSNSKLRGTHLLLSIFGSNFKYSSLGDLKKNDFRNAIQYKISSFLRVPKQSIRILSIQGENPIRVDIQTQESVKVDELIRLFSIQTSPVFLFQINEIKKKMKLYITGIRRLK